MKQRLPWVEQRKEIDTNRMCRRTDAWMPRQLHCLPRRRRYEAVWGDVPGVFSRLAYRDMREGSRSDLFSMQLCFRYLLPFQLLENSKEKRCSVEIMRNITAEERRGRVQYPHRHSIAHLLDDSSHPFVVALCLGTRWREADSDDPGERFPAGQQ